MEVLVRFVLEGRLENQNDFELEEILEEYLLCE